MKVNLEILQQLYPKFGVLSLKTHPNAIKLIKSGNSIKAPIGIEPLLYGTGYQWNEDTKSYTLENQRIYHFPKNNLFIWTLENSFFRVFADEYSLQTWIFGNDKYPGGKVNVFIETYKTEINQNGDSLEGGVSGNSELNNRIKKFPQSTDSDETDKIIAILKRKAGTNKTLPSDLIIKIGTAAKKEKNQKLLDFLTTIKPLDENTIKKSQLEILIKEIVSNLTTELEKLAETHTKNRKEIEEIPIPLPEESGVAMGPGGMSTTSNVSPVTTPYTLKKKSNSTEEQIDEITNTTDGISGYNIPGAFSREGGSKAGVKGSEKLGYYLTGIGREEMKRKADKLYEEGKTFIKKMFDK